MFEVKTSKSIDKGNLNLLNYETQYEFIGRTSVNNGVQGFVDYLDFPPNPKNTFCVIQIGEITSQFRHKEWYASQNIFLLIPNNDKFIDTYNFIVASINKGLKVFSGGYSDYPTLSKLKDLKIQLPVKENNKIDFEFMESFIAELEENHIAELEAYLIATDLKDYNLTNDEILALNEFENLEWKEFKIENLFEIKSYKKRFDANKINLISNSGFPYIVRTALNNGLKGYINEDKKYLNDGNTISFGQDTATIFYQEKQYFTGDKIKILQAKFNKFQKTNAHFFITSMNKSFSKFAWGSSSFSVEIINKQKIQLPTKNGEIDYKFMENFIKAIQKLVIKDVVDFADKKIKLTKKCVKK